MMMRSRVSGSALLHQLAPRLFSTSAVVRSAITGAPANALLAGSSGLAPFRPSVVWMRLLPVRLASTAIGADENPAAKESEAAAVPSSDGKQVGSYWGFPTSKLVKEDGTERRWSCFKICGYDRLSLYKPQHAAGIQTFPCWLWMKSEGGTLKHLTDDNVCPQLNHLSEKDKMVISFSPLENTTMRISGLRNESWKIKITELSQKLTFALIPALLVISKTKLTTSLLVFSVYWQIYGFFKEIFLDYVHQQVTRKWVLLYFKLLLLILAKDTILDFGLI